MANFDLKDYEPVQERIPKFYAKYPDGRIINKLITWDSNGIVFECTLYADAEQQANNTPLATGWAHEVPGAGYVNKTSALENCETSAIGRCLANIGMHGDKRASREEMEKVQRGARDNANPDLFNRVRTGMLKMDVPPAEVDALLEKWRQDNNGDAGKMFEEITRLYNEGKHYVSGEWVLK